MIRPRRRLALLTLILGVAAYSVASKLPHLHGLGPSEFSIRSADAEHDSAGFSCVLCEAGSLPAAVVCAPVASLWLTDAPWTPVDVASQVSAQRLLQLPIRGPPVV